MAKKSFIKKAGLVVWGILLGAVLLEAALRIGGFAILASRKIADGGPRGRHNEYRILCLGESTTYDGGIYCYPNQMEVVLNNKKKGIKFKVINNGVPGIHTEGIVNQLEANLDKYGPDMIVVMMGINDDPSNKLKDVIGNNDNRSFFKGLRVCKLFKILKLGIVNKLEKRGKYVHSGKKDIAADPKTEEKILMLSKELENNPSNDFVVFALVIYYKSQGRIEEIERMFKRLIDINKIYSDRIKLYVDLARFYQYIGKFEEIEKMYIEAIKKTPDFIRLYCELAIYYRDLERYAEAEELYKTAIRIEPGNGAVYDSLGDCYKKQYRYEEAENMYKKARDLNPGHINTFYEIHGRKLREDGRAGEIERVYKKILEIDPRDAGAHYELANCYEKQNRDIEAEEMYKKYTGFMRDYYARYAVLAGFYQRHNQLKLAEKYFKKRDKMDLVRRYDSNVVYNYRKLKESAMKRGLKLVCVQYPMRNAELLKKILGSGGDIAFVDNESVFRAAVKERSYETYFVDCFAGDFGHCTREGNRLLAENIADVILKKYFNK